MVHKTITYDMEYITNSNSIIMDRRVVYIIIFWTLPILFTLWELFFDYLPFVRELLPSDLREALFGQPRSLAEAMAFKIIPYANILSIAFKYMYIAVCYLCKNKSWLVLILTLVPVLTSIAIVYALYQPFAMETPSGAPYHIRLFNTIVGIINICPFYLCVYYLLHKMKKMDDTIISQEQR